MDIALIIISIGALIFLAHLFSWVFSLTHVPDVLFLMAIGILLGPVSGFMRPDFFGDFGNIIVMIVLVMILFEGATKLKFDVLRQAFSGTINLAVVSFFLTMFGTALALYLLLGMNFILALLIGAIVGDNAAAIVVPLIQKLKLSERPRTLLFLESGLSDVLSIVFTITLIAALELGVFRISVLATDILLTFTIAAIIGAACGFFWSFMLNKVRHMENSAFATPAFVFIVFGITELLGFSGLISVIAFGLTLGNMGPFVSSLASRHKFLYAMFEPKTLSKREKSIFSETVFLFQTFFFIYVGLSLNFSNVPLLLVGAVLVILIFSIRVLAVYISVPKDISSFDASVMAITAPRGLATAVLALIPLQRGIAGGQLIQDITWIVVFGSIAMTSLLVFLLYNSRKVREFYSSALPGFSPNPEPVSTTDSEDVSAR